MTTNLRPFSGAVVAAVTILLAAACTPPADGDAPPLAPEVTGTERIPAAIHSAGESPIHAPFQVKEYWAHPCRQRILSRIWMCLTQSAAEVHTVRCPIPDSSFVAVGGGAMIFGGESFPGAFLIDQRIGNFSTKDSWVVSSKSHVLSHAHSLGVYVIGLKIDGVSRAELASNILEHTGSGGTANHPSATVSIPSNRILLSGGLFVPWIQGTSPGQLLVGSWGSPGSALWQVKSKDHIMADPMPINVMAYSIAKSIGGVNLKGIEAGAFVDVNSGVATAQVQAVGAVTGFAGWATFGGEGRMLMRMGPLNHDLFDRKIITESKDHRMSDGGRTWVNAVGLVEDIGPIRCP